MSERVVNVVGGAAGETSDADAAALIEGEGIARVDGRVTRRVKVKLL